MSDFPSRDGDERETTPPVSSSQSSPKASFWLKADIDQPLLTKLDNGYTG
jgi:hypothetical protein